MSKGLEHILRVKKLYKLILRIHRALPAEIQVLGDNYARDEFKRHKNCNGHEANVFLNEWTDYAISMAKQARSLHQVQKPVVGKNIKPEMLDLLRDEQIVQLYELHKATNADSQNEAQGMDDDKDNSNLKP